jgi:elongation factor G
MKRSVAVIGHGGAGKTSCAEAMLFNAKATKRLGSVDNGNSNFDFEAEEQKHKISIYSALHHYDWSGHRVYLVDTPGYSNFLVEARNSLRAVGGAVMLISAASGVKVQSEKVWKYADESIVRRVVFVNGMDSDRANYKRAIGEMETLLGVKDVLVQMPIGEGADFKGVVDLIGMKAYLYDADSSGKYEATDIPDDIADECSKMRESMVESIVELDDALMERYLEGGEFSVDELRLGLRHGVLVGGIVPLFFGSSLKNMGVNLLMDAVNFYLPSALDGGPVPGKDPGSGEEIECVPDPSAPFSASVVKTVIDPYAGRLSVIKVRSGSIKSGATVYNPTSETKEKVPHIFLMEGKKTGEIPEATIGDIVALPKLKATTNGDTLFDPARPIIFEGLPKTSTALAFAIHPKTKGDEEKLASALSKLMEEDSSLEFRRDDQTQEFLLSGVGQLHLEVSIEKLERKFGCSVELKAPRIPYKETIRKSVKVQGRYKKQSGGRGQYGDTWIEMSPLAHGEGFEFINSIVGGVIPKQYIPAVEKGIREAMNKGVLAGYPVVDFKVSLYDGSHHAVDSSEMAFKIAGSMGFKKGVEKANPVLLEPIVNMEISVPDENLGDVIGDINSRRGKILGTDPKGGGQVIKALVPMSEVITYTTELRSMTGDRGAFSMEFSHYEEVPSFMSQKIVEKAKKEKEKS